MVYKGGRDASNNNELSRIGESLNLTIYSQSHDGLEDDVENAVIYFVLPRGTTEATCVENMSLGYHMCIDSGIRAKWLNEDACLRTVPAPRNVFVLSSFTGACYDYLFSFYDTIKFEIIGPQCIRISVESKYDIPIRNKGHPMFTLAMQDIVISMTGYTEKKKEKEELERLVKNMNGTVSPVFTLGTTHIVADFLLTEKTKLAYAKEKPVMTAEWIRAAWKDSQKELIQATDPKYVKYLCPTFYNLNICVSQIPSAKKLALKSIIEANGGIYYNELARNVVNVLVIPNPGGEKYRFAKDWNIPCVTPSWVEKCKSVCHILPVENFTVNGESNDIKSSTPTKSQKKNFFPAVVSMIRNTSRFEVEATICSSRSESVFSNMTTDVLNVVKRASDEGPFLDGCKIYLCGSDTMEQVRKLLNGSGATRLNRLDEHVTHVLVIGSKIPDDDANRIQKLPTKPFLVNMGWLVESAKQGSPADEDIHCFNIENSKANDKFRKNITSQLTPSLSIGDLVERKASSARDKLAGILTPKLPHPRPLIAADKLASSEKKANFPMLPSSIAQPSAINNIEDLSEIQPAAEDCANGSHVIDNDDLASLTEGGYSRVEEGSLKGEEDTHAKKNPFSKKSSGENVRALSQHNKSAARSAEKSSVQDVSQTTTYDGEENDTNFNPPFAGMTFAVQLIPQEKNDIEEIICEMHGEIRKEGCDVVILPVAYAMDQNLIGKSCFTKYWVLDCNEARTTDIPEAKYHTPLPKFKGMRNILEGVVIAVSQYGNSEKSYLATLAMEMGAEYQDVFSRKKTHTTQRTTHLICSVADNDKCTAANKWGVPVVTADWIYDCYRNRKALQGVNYHPSNKKSDSDSTISCIPVTPKANNATTNKHAQRLTALSSVAFYPPSTSKPLKQPVAASDVFATPKAMKRKSSTQVTPVSCGSISDIDIDIDSQTPGENRRSKGNDSDLDLVPAKPVEESPLLWGLSREASRQLKRGFAAACSNSPGPDITSLQVKFKRRIPDAVLMNSIWADLKEKYPPQKAISQNKSSTNQLPVVRVSLKNKAKTSSKQNDIPQKPDLEEDPRKEYEQKGTKKRKTSPSPVEVPEKIEMEIYEIPADNDHSVSSHMNEQIGVNEIMKNIVMFISKRCEKMEDLIHAIEAMGGKVTAELKNSDLTHLVYQGKNAHMSKEVKTVANSDVKVVDPIWIFRCKEKMTLLDEKLYRPGKVSESIASTEKNKSSSKGSLDALENLVQQHDLTVEEEIDASYEDTQGRTIKYKKTENKKVKDDDSDEIECENDDKWTNDANHRPKSANKNEIENVPKTTETGKVNEKKGIENQPEEEKPKKVSKTNAKENSNSKYKQEQVQINSNEKTEEPNAKTGRVTRSRSVAQPIQNQVNDGIATTKKKTSEVEEPVGKLIFSISALNDEQKSFAIQVIEKLGGSISKESIFDFNTDAVIAGTLARSEKVLGSLASGKKLLKLSYINACKNANKFVSLADHIWLLEDVKNDLERQVVVAANYWSERIRKNPLDKPYAKYKVFLVPSKKGPGMTRLILAGGGSVVNSIAEANLVVAESRDKIPSEIPSNVPAQSVTYLSEILLLQSQKSKN